MMLQRWLISFLALLIALTPAAAQDFGIGGSTFFVEGAERPVELTRAACVSNTVDSNSFTLTASLGVGDTSPVLVAYVILGEDGATAFSVSSSTVDGVSATEYQDEGANTVSAAAYALTAPILNADQVDIVVTFSEVVTSVTVCAWALKNLRSFTPTSTIADRDIAGADLILTLGTTTADGYAIGACVAGAIASTWAWGVLVEVEDADNGETQHSNADGATTGSSMAVTCNETGTMAAGAAMAFR